MAEGKRKQQATKHTEYLDASSTSSRKVEQGNEHKQ